MIIEKLLTEIKELEGKIINLKNEIKTETVEENIAEVKVIRVEKIEINQFINKDKIWLKPKNEKENKYDITYKRKGRKTICEFRCQCIVGKGIASCDPKDKFDYLTGITIAELRARSDFYKKVAEYHIKTIALKTLITSKEYR